MKGKRNSEEQIIGILKKAEAGMRVALGRRRTEQLRALAASAF